MPGSITTIAAISTGFGGGIGVVRLSGPDALNVVERIFKPAEDVDLTNIASHTVHYGEIIHNNKSYDKVLVSVMRAPRTYTGEDTVEISSHGSAIVLNGILKLCLENGAVLADRGEFTKRAFLNGKIDLLQAEAVADMIYAKTEDAADQAVGIMKGSLSKKINDMRERVLDALSEFEARIDNPEEETPELNKKDICGSLRKTADEASLLADTFMLSHIIREGVSIGIIGRANVGKSSLFNACIAREKALVSNIAGTTRDMIEAEFVHAGLIMRIADTAGIRSKARGKLERMSVEQVKKNIPLFDVVYFVMDGAKKISSDDRQIAEYLNKKCTKQNIIIILSKSDLKQVVPIGQIKALFSPSRILVLKVSSKTSHNIKLLIDQTASIFKEKIAHKYEGVMISNIRQKEALKKCVEHLSSAISLIESGAQDVLSAYELKSSLNALSEMTGETTSDEILSVIFSKFCIGK